MQPRRRLRHRQLARLWRPPLRVRPVHLRRHGQRRWPGARRHVWRTTTVPAHCADFTGDTGTNLLPSTARATQRLLWAAQPGNVRPGGPSRDPMRSGAHWLPLLGDRMNACPPGRLPPDRVCRSHVHAVLSIGWCVPCVAAVWHAVLCRLHLRTKRSVPHPGRGRLHVSRQQLLGYQHRRWQQRSGRRWRLVYGRYPMPQRDLLSMRPEPGNAHLCRAEEVFHAAGAHDDVHQQLPMRPRFDMLRRAVRVARRIRTGRRQRPMYNLQPVRGRHLRSVRHDRVRPEPVPYRPHPRRRVLGRLRVSLPVRRSKRR